MAVRRRVRRGGAHGGISDRLVETSTEAEAPGTGLLRLITDPLAVTRARAEARYDFTRRIEIYGLTVTADAARRWWGS